MKKIFTIVTVAALLVGSKYKSYTNYKDALINKNGKEIYLLMNEEAGIDTEVESFIYYAIYGI